MAIQIDVIRGGTYGPNEKYPISIDQSIEANQLARMTGGIVVGSRSTGRYRVVPATTSAEDITELRHRLSDPNNIYALGPKIKFPSPLTDREGWEKLINILDSRTPSYERRQRKNNPRWKEAFQGPRRLIF